MIRELKLAWWLLRVIPCLLARAVLGRLGLAPAWLGRWTDRLNESGIPHEEEAARRWARLKADRLAEEDRATGGRRGT